MKKYLLFVIAALITVFELSAKTPVEVLAEQYSDCTGARSFVATGAMMKMARPMLKKYSIAPLADNVTEITVLRVDKVSDQLKLRFMDDLKTTFATYIYAGKSETKQGTVDAYIHISSPQIADELVVFNPANYTLNSLKGSFSIEELKKIQKPVDSK